MNEQERLKGITLNSNIFGGKPIIRGRRLTDELQAGAIITADAQRLRIRPSDA